MSKLSFRARALDANKSLPVYHAEDVPDLPDIASVNRVVPQMPTGMEKEEETEHHLQRAISAQQIYGEAQRLIIPTPDSILYESDYKQLKKLTVQMPKQLIHVQAFTLEDELPDYDCDESDLKWLDTYNKKNSKNTLQPIDLEKMMDILEKGCSSRLDLFTVNDAQALIKKDEKLVTTIYEYWKEKRTKEDTNLTPTVRTEKKDGSTLHDPYVAFRRRVEKMQTRKNRKNDEASYEKMLKLRRDLNRACLILEMVKLREEKKRGLLDTTIKILETRYSNKDFQGELLHQCYDLLKQRQFHQEQPTAVTKTLSSDRTRESVDERVKRAEMVEEARRRHKLLKQRSHLMSSTDETEVNQSAQHAHVHTENTVPEGPDGKYTFRRKKGVIYHAPRYDSMGNWPWTHPVEGGTADSRFCYCCTSVQKKCRCIGFARRRVGRGGRVCFDRAFTPYDDYLTKHKSTSVKSPLPTNGLMSSFQDRVPPWPHFKPQIDSSDEDEDSMTKSQNNIRSNSWLRRDSNFNNDSKPKLDNKPLLHRSFSSQPTSKFRVHPYPSRNTQLHSSSINNQVFLASLTKNVESQHWILRRNKNFSFNHVNSNNTLTTTLHNRNTSLHPTISPSRPASTAPAASIYQLNFPLSTSSNTKGSVAVSTSNNTQKETASTVPQKQSETTTSAVTDSTTRTLQTIAVSTQPSVSRQPLSIVQQQQSFIAQKIIPHQQNNVQVNNLQVQPVVNVVRANKLSITKGLSINHSPVVVSNGITTAPAPGIQLAR